MTSGVDAHVVLECEMERARQNELACVVRMRIRLKGDIVIALIGANALFFSFSVFFFSFQ
jgi:hypothetical protein